LKLEIQILSFPRQPTPAANRWTFDNFQNRPQQLAQFELEFLEAKMARRFRQKEAICRFRRSRRVSR